MHTFQEFSLYLDCEDEDEGEVDENKDDPEKPVISEDTNNLQDQGNSNSEEHHMSCMCDITVTELINLKLNIIIRITQS